MPISDREFELFQRSIDDKFETILNEIREIKATCSKRMDGCASVFKEMRVEVDKVRTDVTKMKTIGGLIVFVWTSALTFIPQILRKLWGD